MQNDLRSSDDIDREIGRRIRFRRIERGYSQAHVASGLGVTYQQLQKYETGRNRISVSTLYRLSRVLGAPVAVFLADPDDPALLEEGTVGSAMFDCARQMERLASPVQISLGRLIDAIGEFERDR